MLSHAMKNLCAKKFAMALVVLFVSCKKDPTLDNAPAETSTSGGSGGSTITGTTNHTADGVDTSTITITLLDLSSQPIIGVTPTFTATDTDATNSYGACSATNSSGISTCSMTSTRAEVKTLSVTSPVSFSDDTIEFVHGVGTHLEYTAQPGPLAVAGQDLAIQPVLQIQDAFDNPVLNAVDTVTLAVYTNAGCTVPGGGTLNATTNPIVGDGITGTYIFSNVNYTMAETIYLAAETPGYTDQCVGPITVDNNNTYHLEIVTQPSGAETAGAKFATQPVIEIRDSFDNLALVGGVDTDPITVTAHTNPGCSSVGTGTLRAPTNPVNAVGAIGNFNLDYTRAETIYLEFTSPGKAAACSNAIVISPDVADAGASSITGTQPTAANNYHKSNISITIMDQFSNPISGVTPTFDATDTGATNSYDACTVTDAAGNSTCTMDSGGVEVKTLSLQTPIVKADGTVNFVEPPDPGNTTIVGSSAVADLVDSSTITITLLDQFSAPVVGFTPTFSATDTGATNVQGACTVTNGSGVSTCGLMASYAEVKTLTINQPLLMVGGTATFTHGPAVAANSNISGTTNVIADGVATSTVTITLRDQYNNPVIGTIPTFSATDTGTTNSYNICSASNASGISTCTMTSTVAENKTLSIVTPIAKADGNVDFIPGPAAQLVYTQQPSSTSVAGVAFAQQPTVQIQDAFGNIRNTDTSAITLVPHTNVSCTNVAGGTLGATANPQNANGTNGSAVFAGVNYDTMGFVYLRAELGGINVCSNSINITPAPAAKVVFINQPTDTTSTQNITPAITVEIQDAFDNLVNSTDNVTLSISNDPSVGATLGGTLTVAAIAGTATFSDINIDKVGVGFTLNASSGVLTNDVSGTFDILVGPGVDLAFSQQPSDTQAGDNVAPGITVQILDAGGNLTAQTDSITLAINNDPSVGATLSGTLTQPAISGTATFSDININKTGTGFTLDATAVGLTTDTSNAFNIVAGTPTQLIITQEPTDALSTATISPSVLVEIRDANDNLCDTATDTVNIAINNDPSVGATLSGTVGKAAIAGVATFDDLSIDKIGTGFTLNVTSGALTLDTSATFDILLGPATQVVFTQEPTDALAGVDIAPAMTVEIQDAGGNVTADTDIVTLAISNDPSVGAALGGTLAVAAIAGVATFNDIDIDKIGTGFTLDATSGVLTSATSASFNITPNTPTKLAFLQEPTDALAATNISPAITVQILDAFDNLTGSTDSITLAINNDPSVGAILSGTLTQAAVAGTATFNDINIDKIGTGFTLDATSGVLTLDTSASFNITPAAATKVVFVQEPTDAVAGVDIAPAITVEIRDASDNLVSSTDNVTLAINNDPSVGATLGGTLTVAAIGGVATFGDIDIDKIGTGFTLDATSGVLTTDTSASFNITPNVKTQLAFIQEPTDAQSAVNISPAITVEIQDAYGNNTGDTDTITLAINNDPSVGATLSGTLAQAAVAGTATFNDINIDKIGTGYTLDGTAGGLTTATSASFNITPAPATKVVFLQEPTDTQSVTNISPSITVQLLDANDNLTSQTDSITLAINNDPSVGATLSGTLTKAAVAGTATFDDIQIDKIGTGFTLDATSGVLTADTSASFNITLGPKAQLAFIQDPTDAVSTVNIGPAMTVEIQDAGGNKTADTDNVTLSFNNDASGSTASLMGTLTVGAINGTATFSDINIDVAAVGYTFDADSGALTTATSAAFNITAGPPAKVAFVQEPTDTASGSNITPAITVQILDASDNLTSSTDNVTLAINNDPSIGATLSGTLTRAAIAGTATFNDINIDKIGTGFTLDATSGVLTADTSVSFNITEGAPAKLVFNQEPTDAVSGVNIAPAITVDILDANDNPTTATNSVTLAINNDPSVGATLSGTLTLAAISGTATFNDINIDKMGTGFTLDATAGGLTTATSATFNISPGPKAQLAFVQEPTPTVANTAIAPAMTVEIQDANGNNTGDTDTITLAINNDPSVGATLSGTLAQAAVGGIATFNDIDIDLAGSGYTLDATAGGLTTATSVSFDITFPTVTITAPGHVNNSNKTAYTVSGTCSENGQTVDVNIGSLNVTPTCTANAWTTGAQDVSAQGDTATFSITADHQDIYTNNANDSTDVIKDTIDPSDPTGINLASGTVTGGSPYNSPLFSWTNPGADYFNSEVALGTTSGGQEVIAYNDIGNTASTTMTSISEAECTVLYPIVRSADEAGNTSAGVVHPTGFYYDNTDPADPSSLDVTADDASETASVTTTWTGSDNCNIDYYEIAVSTTTGTGGIVTGGNWTSVGTATTGRILGGGLSLAVATNYYTLVRAYDEVGNVSNVVASAAWQLFDPASALPNMIVWLDAADHTTVKDASGFDADNGSFAGTVQTWEDKSGSTNTHHFTAVNASARPTWDGVNDYLDFDGTNDYMTTADHAEINTATVTERNITVAFKTDSDVNTRQVIYEEGGGVRGMNIYIYNGSLYCGFWNDTNDGDGIQAFTEVNTSVSADTVYSVTWVYDYTGYTGPAGADGDLDCYVNNSNIGSTTTTSRLFAHSGDVGLGGTKNDTVYENGVFNGDGDYFKGDIFEVMLFNDPPDSGDISTIHGYLDGKW